MTERNPEREAQRARAEAQRPLRNDLFFDGGVQPAAGPFRQRPDDARGAPDAGEPPTSIRRSDPTFAWLIALAPLVWVAVPFLAPKLAVATWPAGALWLACIVLAFVDSRRLPATHRGDWGWAVLLAVGYLVARTRALRSTPAIPIVWVICALVALGASTTFGKVQQYDAATVQPEIRSWLIKQGAPSSVSVSCPDIVGRVGATFDCVATSGTQQAIVQVTIHDSSIVWQLAASVSPSVGR